MSSKKLTGIGAYMLVSNLIPCFGMLVNMLVEINHLQR